MNFVLLAMTLVLGGPAGAQTAPPSGAPATGPGENPAVSAQELAKVRAALRQLNDERDHFTFTPPDDDAPVVTVGRPAESGGIASRVTVDPNGAPADAQSPPPPPFRRPAGADVHIHINDQIKSVTGVDLGPIDVSIGNKLRLSHKF